MKAGTSRFEHRQHKESRLKAAGFDFEAVVNALA